MDDTIEGVSFESKVKSFDAFAVGVIPIKKFEIFGKAGVAAWDRDDKLSTSTETEKHTGFDFKYGIGGAFLFSKHFAVRAEWESFELDDDTLSMASLGLELRF